MDEIKIRMDILLQVTQQERDEARQENTFLKAMIAQIKQEQETDKEVNEDSSDTVQTNELDK